MSIAAKLGAFFCDMAGVKHGDSFWVALEERDHKEVMEAILQRAQVLEPGQVLVVPASTNATTTGDGSNGRRKNSSVDHCKRARSRIYRR